LSTGDRQANVRRAIEATRELIRRGYAPLCPHLTTYVDPTDELGHATWLEVDRPWVLASDAVLRLPGISPGADMEVAWATEAGIPVVHSLDELEAVLHPTILEEAQRLVYGDRERAYGHPREDFGRTAQMWSALFGHPFRASDVPLAMICVKLAREMHGHKRDNLTDIAGYAAALDRLYEGVTGRDRGRPAPGASREPGTSGPPP
jgi:hypothetical protein